MYTKRLSTSEFIIYLFFWWNKIELTECPASQGPKKVYARIFFEREEWTDLRKLLGILEYTFKEYKKNFPH